MGRVVFELLSAQRGLAVVSILATTAMTLAPRPAQAVDSSLEAITAREISRREGIVTQAQAQLTEAASLRQAGKNEEATRVISAAYDSLPQSPIAEATRVAARAAFADAALAWAAELLKAGSRKEGIQIIETVLASNMDPKNAAAKKLLSQANDSDRYPPALTPRHTQLVAEVTSLLTKADSALNLGNFDQAKAEFSHVLRLDPTNTAARRGMERAEQHRAEYFEAARDHFRSKALNGVNSLWEDALPPANLAAMLQNAKDVATASGSAMLGGRERIQKKLRDLKMARVEFTDASLDEVVEYLRVVSKDIDPERKGVSFVIKAADDTRSRKLTLNVNDVPLEEVVRYATEMTGSTYRIEEHAVSIVSLSEKSTSLISKTYRVPPDFIQTSDAAAPAANAAPDPFAAAPAAGTPTLAVRRMGAKEFLQSRGVTFPEGAAATYSAATSSLIVRNTTDNMNLIDVLVEQSLQSAPKQVVISMRMVHVKQEVFNEIGSALALGQANVPALDRVFFSGGQVTGTGELAEVTSGLRPSGAIQGRPSIDAMLALAKGEQTPPIDSVSPSQFNLLGVFSDPQFSLTLRAIRNSKGVDVVSNPSVVARSGQKASIRNVREFPYPTEFDPPEIPQQISPIGTIGNLTGNTSGPVTPTTPTAFETREVGVIMEVEPVISADGRMVELSLSPQLIEFDGFLDYGSDISNQLDINVFDPVLPTTPLYYTIPGVRYTQDNPVLQPVFRRSSTTTAVNIWDGSTVVIGGLVDERRTDIADKVPVIGDIPLIGRMFQSKISKTEKQAVLFFVTVNVIDPSGTKINAPAEAAVGAQ